MRNFVIDCGGSARGNYRNGRRGHPLYETWRGMIARCENTNRHDFRHYGGRGIAVCAAWHEMSAFADWAEQSGWQKGLTLDRIDNDGDYTPDNCRWASRKEQAQNRRPRKYQITVRGETMSLAEAARRHGLHYMTLRHRLIKRGWSVEEALKPPR